MQRVVKEHPHLSALNRAVFERLLAYRPSEPDDFGTAHRRASVLVPLSINPDTDEIEVLLTLRSSKLRTQPGQISFPGGRQDPTDPTAYDAALREAHEEIGLDKSEPILLSTLNPRVSMAQAIVTPFVALVRDGFKAVPNEHEVDAVFKVPLSLFLSIKGKSYVDFHLAGFGDDVYERNHGWHVTPPPSAVVYSNHMLELLRDGAIPHNDGAPAKLQLSGPPPPGSEPPQRRPPPGVEMTMVSGRSGPQPRFRVFGLTADIAIEAALLAYGRQPEYLFRLSKQPTSRGLLQMWIAGGQLGRGSIINSGREEDDGDHSDPTLKKQKL